MATQQQEAEAAYVRDHWDSQARATNYLLAGHGAVLIACLTVLKEDSTAFAIKGLGTVGALSAAGLLLAALAHAAAVVCRSLKVKKARGTSNTDAEPIAAAFKVFQIGSFVIFVAEISVVGFHFYFS